MACIRNPEAFVYHLIFYATEFILGAFAAYIIFSDLDPRIRTQLIEMDMNVVGDNPGLSFRPMIYRNDGNPSSLISYDTRNRTSYIDWTNSLDEFTRVYRAPGLLPARRNTVVSCDFNRPPGTGQVCDVDLRRLGHCIPENRYNYHKGAPCVFLRLNMPDKWTPVYYNDSKSLPIEMPLDLVSHIKNLEMDDPKKLNTVWVTCKGEDPADVENIGPLMYLEDHGFPGYMLINRDVEGYLPPLFAILFERPISGILIRVKCEAWARNIKHDDDSSLGGVRFQIMID